MLFVNWLTPFRKNLERFAELHSRREAPSDYREGSAVQDRGASKQSSMESALFASHRHRRWQPGELPGVHRGIPSGLSPISRLRDSRAAKTVRTSAQIGHR